MFLVISPESFVRIEVKQNGESFLNICNNKTGNSKLNFKYIYKFLRDINKKFVWLVQPQINPNTKGKIYYFIFFGKISRMFIFFFFFYFPPSLLKGTYQVFVQCHQLQWYVHITKRNKESRVVTSLEKKKSK